MLQNIKSQTIKMLRNAANNVILPMMPSRVEQALRKADQRIKRLRHKELYLETLRFIEQYMPATQYFSGDFCLLEYAISQIENIHNGDLVCEFGVGNGRTINHIARLLPNTQIFGFDSFEGLPEDWRPGFPKGTYAMRKLPKVLPSVILVKGWFDETLTPFLSEHPGKLRFLHVDCDLYSSTRTILAKCHARIQPGTVIVFDEYFNYPGWKDGEYKAFTEFIENFSFSYKYIGYCRYDEQVAVKII